MSVHTSVRDMNRNDLRSTADGAAENGPGDDLTGCGVVSGVLVSLLFTPWIVFVLAMLSNRLLPADFVASPSLEILAVAIPLGAALLTLLVPSWRLAGAGLALGLALGSILAVGILWWLIWPIIATFGSS